MYLIPVNKLLLKNFIFHTTNRILVNDPELKAMSEVFDALQELDAITQVRVVDWVMAKLNSTANASLSTGAKRGPKSRGR